MDDPLINRVIELAIAIQQIPAPTFAEGPRANFLREQFIAEGLADVQIDEIGNVYARLPGDGRAPPLVVTAHTDTVFPMGTNLHVVRQKERIFGPGLGDNALGVAGLLGLVWTLRERGISLPGDLCMVANVGEEGLGDLRGMQAVVARFKDQALAFIALEGIALGHIFHQGMGVQRYRIRMETAGGHSWVDFGRPSAIHELAGLITRLTSLPLSEQPRTTLNVGVISGGITVNTIAPTADLELDLRSESEQSLNELAAEVKALALGMARRGLKVDVRLVGQRPAGGIPADHPLVDLAMASLRSQDIEPRLNTGSTDANLPLSQGLAAICVGLTTGGGAHTLEEYIDIEPLGGGMAQLISMVENAYKELGR